MLWCVAQRNMQLDCCCYGRVVADALGHRAEKGRAGHLAWILLTRMYIPTTCRAADFQWLDPLAPPPSLGYSHWGSPLPGDIAPEPNNLAGDEYCAGTNLTQAADGAGGWSDERWGARGRWQLDCLLCCPRWHDAALILVQQVRCSRLAVPALYVIALKGAVLLLPQHRSYGVVCSR